jgi:hypothetical protein
VSAGGLAAIRDHVVASPELAGRLAAMADADELFAAVLEVASAIGAAVTPDDLAAALDVGTRRGLERWL